MVCGTVVDEPDVDPPVDVGHDGHDGAPPLVVEVVPVEGFVCGCDGKNHELPVDAVVDPVVDPCGTDEIGATDVGRTDPNVVPACG